MSDAARDITIWQDLKTNLRWSRALSVVYVFAATPAQARSLGAKLRDYADPATLRFVEAHEPGDLRHLARELQPMLEDLSRPIDFYHRPFLWIDGSLEFEHDDGPWREAWADLIGRLNERRELLRLYVRSLVIVAPLQAKAALRSMGPDLWSIRTTMLEFPRVALPVPGPASPLPTSGAPDDARRARALLEVEPPPGDGPQALLAQVKRIRAAARLARAEMRAEALDVAAQARQACLAALDSLDLTRPEIKQFRAEVLSAWLEQVEVALQLDALSTAAELLRRVEAELERAIESPSPRDAILRVEALTLAGELALASNDADAAKRALELAETANEAVARGETPFSYRIAMGLARAAAALGNVQIAKHQLERALGMQRSNAPLRELASLALATDDARQAVLHLEQALALTTSAPLAEQIAVRRELAAAYMHGSHWPAARDQLEAAIRQVPPDSLLLADCLIDLATLERAVGDDTRASECLRRASELRMRLLGSEHPLSQATRRQLESVMKSKLVILHMSDLHFGPSSRFGAEPPRSVGERFGLAIERLRAEAGLGVVDLVVISGDLTETADEQEFSQALAFCEALNGRLALGRDRWAFVPGNHDFSWPHIELARIEQKIQKFDDEELDRRVREYKFLNYRAFIEKFYGEYEDDLRLTPLTPAGWVHDIPALRVSLGLLNSSECTTDLARWGKVSREQAQALLNQWRARTEPTLRIMVVHHNPQEVDEPSRNAAREWLEKALAKKVQPETIAHFVADNFGLEGKEVVEQVATQARVPLVLHGHVHSTPRRTWEWSDGRSRTYVLGAGSGGAAPGHLPADEPNSVQLLALDLETGAGQVHRLRWDPRPVEPGRVERGTFVPEAAEAGGVQPLYLTLPEGLVRGSGANRSLADDESDQAKSHERNFLREYRTRLRSRFEVWELGTRQRGARQASVVTLDEMYVPLRIDAGYDQEKYEAGKPIGPDDLLARERGMIVRGGPGSGKTTWLRWTFRRLLEREDVLPVFVELRVVAKRWSTIAAGDPRSFESYLSVWLTEAMGASWEPAFRAALDDEQGPRPVLLIDGWDELGDFGRELGQQLLSFSAAHPHVLIVATSRPYGEGISELTLRFDELQVQPMSDAEVAAFVRNFYERVHRSEAERVSDDVDRFLATLRSNPQAEELGRTPLLLVMLLMIGRDRPLPDQRHELYRVCIEDLLDARPKQRQAMGVLMGSWEWAPERYAERRRAAARLAWAMQSRHLNTQAHIRGAYAIATREQLTRELDEWDPHQREGFITWLSSGAGLLIEREDGFLHFAHLGFQEYLTACHLDSQHDGTDQRIAGLMHHVTNIAWWETLRLWAALVESRLPEHLSQPAGELMKSKAGYWFVGAVLADGLADTVFSGWLDLLQKQFGPGRWGLAIACARAWSHSQQLERKNQIARSLRTSAEHMVWTNRRRANMWHRSAGFDGVLPLTQTTPSTYHILKSVNPDEPPDRCSLAWGRFWNATSPFWGNNISPLHLAIRIWPNDRQWYGWAIQSALGLGASLHKIAELPWTTLRTKPSPATLQVAALTALTPAVLELTDNAFNTAWGNTLIWRGFLVELATYISSLSLPNDPLDHFTHFLRTESLEHSALPSELTSLELASFVAATTGDVLISDDTTDKFTTVLERKLQVPPQEWLRDFARVLLCSTGFVGTRTLLASQDFTDPLLHLLHHASLASIDPATLPDLDAALDTYQGHPMWPALARHIARMSTAEDRTLLINLARDPSSITDDILRWSLEFLVRGDVMLPDGSTITLDEIWAHQGLDPLPYLEDVPSYNDIDWDAIEREAL